MDWDEVFRLNQIRHAELIFKGEESRRGSESRATEDQDGDQASLKEQQSQILRRGEDLEVLAPDCKKAVGQ